jgi:hypothetical protein
MVAYEQKAEPKSAETYKPTASANGHELNQSK